MGAIEAIPTWYFLNLYLQQVLGLGAFEGGAALLPMTGAIMSMMVFLAQRVIARFGPKVPIDPRAAARGGRRAGLRHRRGSRGIRPLPWTHGRCVPQ